MESTEGISKIYATTGKEKGRKEQGGQEPPPNSIMLQNLKADTEFRIIR